MPRGLAAHRRWRTGRKVGRTIYAQLHPEASDEDELIGVMDTDSLAAEAVESHNSHLDRLIRANADRVMRDEAAEARRRRLEPGPCAFCDALKVKREGGYECLSDHK